MMENDVVDGPVEKVTCKEMMEAVQTMKSPKETGQLEVRRTMITASNEI